MKKVLCRAIEHEKPGHPISDASVDVHSTTTGALLTVWIFGRSPLEISLHRDEALELSAILAETDAEDEADIPA